MPSAKELREKLKIQKEVMSAHNETSKSYQQAQKEAERLTQEIKTQVGLERDITKVIGKSRNLAKEFEKILYERQFRTIISYQKHIVQNVNGLNFPINIYNDFEFENMIVDTKSTLRCPSAPYPKDLRQVSIYSKLIGKPVTLLYATPKKHLWYELTAEEVDKYYEEVCINFKQLENYIMTCNNSLEQAIRITPLDTTPRPFKWDDNIKQEAEKIWKKVNQ